MCESSQPSALPRQEITRYGGWLTDLSSLDSFAYWITC